MTRPRSPGNPDAEIHPGDRLRRARQQQGLGITDVARSLKLSRTTVEDIEAGRLDRIAPIYRRGYIVNYARLVGRDPQPLLDDLGAEDPAPLRNVLPVVPRGQRFDRFLKFATYALVTTVIVPPLVYFFILGGARLFDAEMVAGSDATDAARASGADEAGYRERLADALAVGSADDGELQNEAPLSASALPVALRRPEDPGSAGSRPGAVPPASEAVVGQEEPADGDGASLLELNLSDDSWVEIEDAGGERLEFDLLRSGQQREYRGVPPFRVLFGRASAVEVSLDGRPIGFEGDDSAGVAEFLLSEPPADQPAPDGRSGGEPRSGQAQPSPVSG